MYSKSQCYNLYIVIYNSFPTPTHHLLPLTYQVPAGATVGIVGSHPRLGSWDPSKAAWASSMDGRIWSTLISLPAKEDHGNIEFKAILKKRDGNVDWEEGPNRVLDTASAQAQGNSRAATVTMKWDWEGDVAITARAAPSRSPSPAAARQAAASSPRPSRPASP